MLQDIYLKKQDLVLSLRGYEPMYKIDKELFEKKYLEKNSKPDKIGFKHEPNTIFKDLPFVVKDKNITTEFTGVMGEYVRILLRKRLKEPVNREKVIENIKSQVQCNGDLADQYQLTNLIKQIYFEENGELSLFSNQAMLYLNATSNDKKIAQFIYDVLNKDEEISLVETCLNKEPDNVLDALMYKALPELQPNMEYAKAYTQLVPHVTQLFIEDFRYVIGDQERFKKYLKKLISYYYFFYISQLSIKLNKMFEADPNKVEALFFSVEWEKMSKSRQGYDYGWKKLEPNIKKLFSHSKLLEMLNQNDSNDNKDYIRIKKDQDIVSETSFGEDVRYIIQVYIENITDFNFEQVKYKEQYETDFLNDILYLFNCIDAQFQGTTRERAYTGYSKWFIEYCKANTLKNRRSLGYTLNLTEEDIIFLTKICIKDREKIKLKDLFKEFERRGIRLDLKTKEEINSYYEKLNLIEKKSDSGDAQYVKGIL